MGTTRVKKMAERFHAYIDYDEDPEIGGQQGLFFLDGGHSHDFKDLIGTKIIHAEFNNQVLGNSRSDAKGRVLILTLEKTDNI